FKLVSAEGIREDDLELEQPQLLGRWLSFSPTREWRVALPSAGDHQQHSSEVSVPESKIGAFYLLASGSPKFDYRNEIVSFTRINVSNIGYVERNFKGGKQYFIHDRTSGEPLKSAKVNVFARVYDQLKRKYVRRLRGTYNTDEDGLFLLKTGHRYEDHDVELDISYKGDQLATGEQEYSYNYGDDEHLPKVQEHVFFFLDRGIYRPGQTIYFKGLLMQTINGQNVLMKSTKRKVQLYDVNSKLVTELQLTSNDYGTFNGSFTLPVSGINGTMYIQTPNVTGYKNFRVEEYKRPRFEAKFDPVKGSFRLGDKVTIKGKATTYSGVAVDGAMVQYRIRRSAVFPYANLFSWKISYPDEVDKEIASGKVTTTQNGEFTIDFTANSDPSVSDEKLPQYTYSISVDVTDQNGETQSTQSSVNVGVLALRTNMQLSENYSTTDSQNVKLSTENLNGEFEAAKGSIRIYRLKDPALIKRERLWRAPDQFAISEADYKKKFPLDIYKDEDRYQDWSREQQALDISFDSEKDKTFKLQGLSSWKQGKYLAELETKDHFGKTVKEIKYFTVYDPRNNQMPFTQLSWIHEVATTLEPGGKAQVLIGSSEKNVKVLYEVILKDEVIHKEWITLNNEKKLVELPIEERFRGNVTMNFTFVRDERLFAMPVLVKVPYSNKELKLSFITFRDKLSPGKKEEWKIKISGPAGEKVAAEMLAGMYDASLDAFAPNEWSLDLYPGRAAFDYRLSTWALPNAVSGSVNIHELPNPVKEFLYQAYDALNWFIMPQGDMRYRLNYRRGDVLNTTYCWSNANAVAVGGTQAFGYSANAGTYKLTCHDCNGCCATRATVRFATDFKFEKKDKEQQEVSEFSPAFLKTGEGKDAWGTMPIVKARANFAETAFFLPKLETDTAGNILFNFTVPDALSRWKFLALAHTKDLKSGSITKDAVTQKDLMVNPNAPRFLREGDEIELTAKVNSLIDKELSGNAQLTLTDPFTGKVVTTLFGKDISLRPFNLKKGQSTTVSWKLKVPEGLGVITYKITAAAGNFTDGEEAPLPILTNRMLVTEILPINVKGGQEKSFSLEKLVNSSGSKTMVNHRLTFELSSNPAWYAVQALPYMMEFPHECSEQLFNRFYANSIATHIANSSPRIKQVFESWKGANTPASNLEKNAELKQLLLEETPWVLQGQDETQRKNRVGLLFNLNKMSAEQATALKKLKDNQSINGGWPWFKGMPDNRFITQYVITGLGRMDKLGALNINRDYELQQMTLKGVQYLDNRILEDYRELLKEKIDLKLENVSDIQIQYLYARSFFKEQRVPENIKVAYQYYFDQAQKNWLKQDKYSQAMIAIILHRSGNSKASDEILHSLQETATKNEELGMYWKDNVAGYYWYQAPIETQAMMIEAFSQSGKNEVVVDELRTWLLKQKQVQDWKTTKATSDACYALLLSGSDWLNTTEIPEVTIGGVKIEPGKNAPKADPGTGYFKTSWSTSEIKPEMGKVSVKKQSKGIAWGALYYQYFEQLDKITSAKSPLQLAKKLFLQTNGSKGPVLTPINDHTELKTGDLVKVRIELRSDREMDFVQMKDMRASGFEPVSVLSSYKYQDGLGYYESPKDASTNFFFDHLPKGTFVFEYALRVSQKGDFSNGITTIQSMYAPEFSSHSEGVRVGVK
ncbi:MAG: hypothetical protein JWO06_2483, partial [Bacteroidota bacterium]|nr:hypothetical protein [Bacteroidota bacterium]